MTSRVIAAINPYSSQFSSYGEWRDGELIATGNGLGKVSAAARDAHREFRLHVNEGVFPCTGAKAALSGGDYRFSYFPSINSAESSMGLAHDLWEFARDQATFDTNFTTFAVSFGGDVPANERAWENAIWSQLQRLHEMDIQNAAWDYHVSDDPDSPLFSFSFAETGFFVVGLHPNSSRISRRSVYPTMVFNVHAQFERLKETGVFQRMQTTIRARDMKLQGTLNPNLSDYGTKSEANQYSGRAVEPQWKCPFRRLYASKKPTSHKS